MKSIFGKLASLALLVAAWFGSAAFTLAHAVRDLPGGPAVNQLNLHPPVTRIAADQAWLHWFMLIVCTVIFVAVFGGHVLFDLEAPQVGRAQGGHLP